MPNIFVPPIATQRAPSAARELSSGKNKRKRMKIQRNVTEGEEHDYDVHGQSKTMTNLDYTAVVSPLERLQRRVAGQPLDQPPPPFPFPHAESPLMKSRAARKNLDEEMDRSQASKPSDSSRSFHGQHLAALTAVVHRSLLKEDFPRAARALGLMFHEDIVSKSAAVRTQGYMGIAAEVLLRNGTAREPTPNRGLSALPFTHEGFEKAKLFYERLIVRHPYHKSWPEAVNAVDYYLAMFNLWIFAVQAEYTDESTAHEDDESDVESTTSSPRAGGFLNLSSKKVRELEQANRIASRMDTCMATVPYMDEAELIRLRAMVALWIADLHKDCARAGRLGDLDAGGAPLDQDSPALSSNQDLRADQKEHIREAARARDKAQDLLSRLESQARSDGE
ncbi:uncharacterized protein Z519_07785 [Cladophialophora bantiana CBS 173.52]|uniref:Uncharacterized protein n=1 Tax=Cladophialophora bantiana (strain ATCC 10958 / CBS 173.52 / CDC B-1940 / NIH 8579) TaxID=1442370 RepID=A0A0D2HLZ0_CLAB1|nr:uncharacterized protein Z519_07785 [Cladophialophora bantiana CBS 173.52]KIW91815.1 hypothetical protein Z519_07785 [Cladophialophora bantiana CBS 173.52]